MSNWPDCGHTALGACKRCFDEQAAELAIAASGLGKVEAMLEDILARLSAHTADAQRRWHDAHPGQQACEPSLKVLLEWLVAEMGRMEAELNEAGLPRLLHAKVEGGEAPLCSEGCCRLGVK